MRAFKVSLNGKSLCLAGVGERGVLSAIVNWVAGGNWLADDADLFMDVGGIANEVHVDWVSQKRLQVGDEVRVKIVDVESVDKPIRERRTHPAETLNAKKRYVRRAAKELGWQIKTRPKRSS